MSFALVIGLLRRGGQLAGKQSEELPLARVYNQYLYSSDLVSPLTKAEAGKNFQRVKEKSVHDWVINRLLVVEAESASNYNKTDIERQVLEYRYGLLAHTFLDSQAKNQLDTEVSEESIVKYYKAHQEDFLLHSNIFKGQFIIIPQKSPHRAQINRLLRGSTVKNQKALAAYCEKFAKNYSLDGGLWLQWDELIRGTSLSKKANMLNKGKFLQARDQNYIYYFKIDECHKIGTPAPLELIEKKIINIILYQRKSALVEKIKQEILQKAKGNNKCVIYEEQ